MNDTYNEDDDYRFEAAMDAFNRDRETARDRMVVKGSVVCTKQHGWKRVTAVFKNTVNVEPIFGGRGRFSGNIRGIPHDEVFEDHDRWYKNWQESDAYKCM